MTSELEELVLRRARAGLGPSPTRRGRVLEALVHNVGKRSPDELSPSPDPPAHGLPGVGQASFVPGHLVLKPRTLIVAMMGSAALGWGGGYTWHTTQDSAAVDRVTSPRQVDAPAAAPTGEEVFDESLLVEPDMAALEEQPSQEKHGAIQRLSQRGEKERSASPAQPVEATFYKELSYVRRAQAALRDGQSALALGLMQELDGLPTKGALGAERNVTKVLALCQLGRELEAANIAAKVVQADTGRVYQQRLKGSCAGKHLPEP